MINLKREYRSIKSDKEFNRPISHTGPKNREWRLLGPTTKIIKKEFVNYIFSSY
jgi:hypothetical protein